MKLRVAIVEDDIEAAKLLAAMINEYSIENKCDFESVFFSDGDEITDDYRPLYDIIFLDIEMARLNGVDAAEVIRKYDKDVIIIFVTHMVQHALKGYAVNALSYLLKPVTKFALFHELNRAVEKLSKRVDSYFFVTTENAMVRLNTNDIIFFESVGHKVLIKTATEEYLVSGTIKGMVEKMSKYSFFRCNNGYLVNLAAVTGIMDGCAIVAGYKLPISRPRKKDFVDALTKYMGALINE